MFALSIILLVIAAIAGFISLYNNKLFKEKTVKIASLVLILFTLLFQIILENYKNDKDDESRKIIATQQAKIDSLIKNIDSIKKNSSASVSLAEITNANITSLKSVTLTKDDLSNFQSKHTTLETKRPLIGLCPSEISVHYKKKENGRFTLEYFLCNSGNEEAIAVISKAYVFTENNNKIMQKYKSGPLGNSSTSLPTVKTGNTLLGAEFMEIEDIKEAIYQILVVIEISYKSPSNNKIYKTMDFLHWAGFKESGYNLVEASLEEEQRAKSYLKLSNLIT
jgi:hypothetical protein